MATNKSNMGRVRELTAADQASAALIDTGWRRLRSFTRDSSGSRELTVDVWGKGSKIIVVETFPDGGFELFYPSSMRKTSDTIAEANGYAMGAVISIGPMRERQEG